MKFFFDTEFIERGPQYPIELISIGVVAEDGREYYAISTEFNPAHASPWVVVNVLSHLTGSSKTLKEIRRDLIEFCGEKPVFWSYYCDYDWVVLCQIFGTMMDLPEGWPMFCMDLKQLAVSEGNPILPDLPDATEHHALSDAREIKYRYDWLMGNTREARFLKTLTDEELKCVLERLKRDGW